MLGQGSLGRVVGPLKALLPSLLLSQVIVIVLERLKHVLVLQQQAH